LLEKNKIIPQRIFCPVVIFYHLKKQDWYPQNGNMHDLRTGMHEFEPVMHEIQTEMHDFPEVMQI
jgi:hypothetical protein